MKLADKIAQAYGVFAPFAPWHHSAQHYYCRYLTLTQDGTYHLMHADDEYNSVRVDNGLSPVLVEYRLGDKAYPIVTLDKLRHELRHTRSSSPLISLDKLLAGDRDEVVGFIAEPIVQAALRTMLSRAVNLGELDASLDKTVNRAILKGTDFHVAHSAEYALKVTPERRLIVIRQQEGKGGKFPPAASGISEIDCFQYFNGEDGKPYIVVCESKTGQLKLTKGEVDRLVEKKFAPLRDIYGDARILYCVVGPRKKIYTPKTFSSDGQRLDVLELKPGVARTFRRLLDHDIGTAFFVHRERPSDFARMRDHIRSEFARIIQQREIDCHCHYTQGEQVTVRPKHVKGGDPYLVLVRREDGLWEEKPINGEEVS